MSVETDFRGYLINDAMVSGLIGTRVYPLMMPQGFTLPAVTYQRVSSDREYDLTDGPVGWCWARFQLDCYADSFSGVRELAEAVRQALDWNNGITIEGERDLFEENTEVYRVTQDYLVPHSETP